MKVSANLDPQVFQDQQKNSVESLVIIYSSRFEGRRLGIRITSKRRAKAMGGIQ